MSEVLTLSYWFWPNPGNLHYGDPNAMIAIGVSVGLIALSFLISFVRRRLGNPVTVKLSRSWSSAAVWFGVLGLVMVVSRVESILFLGMRALWVAWALALAAYVAFQVSRFRSRHYTVVRTEHALDPRDQYLPRKKNK